MSFLHPAMLFALPVALIPLVIHLLNRRRFQKKSWGAMQFLREAMEERRGRRRFKHWLLLLLRTVLLVALVLAMSRPLVGGWLAGWIGGWENDVILVMDRSASMERRLQAGGVSKRELAMELVEASREALQPSSLTVIDSASREIRLIENGQSWSRGLGATSTAADLPALLGQALDTWESGGMTRGELWVVSDLQEGTWHSDRRGAWADLSARYAKLGNPPRVRLLLMPGGEANRSVRCRVGKNRQLEVSIRQSVDIGGQEERVPLTLRLGEQEVIQEVTLTGELTEVSLVLPQQQAVMGSVSLPEDGNPADNQAHFAVGPPAPSAVSLVCEDDAVSSVLQLAVSPWPQAEAESRVRVVRHVPGEELGHPWEEDALVIWQGPPPVPAVRRALEAAVSSGGQLLILPTRDELGELSYAEDPWGFGVRLGEKRMADEGEEWTIAEWTQDDGPLRDTDAGVAIPVSRLRAQQHQLLELGEAGDTSVLASWANGEACLMRRSIGSGNVYFLGTLPVDTWSTLGEGLILVPLLQRMLADGAGSRSPVQIGPPEEAPWRAGVWEQDLTDDGAPMEWRVAERPLAEDVEAFVTVEDLPGLMGDIPFQTFEMVGGEGLEDASSDWWRPFLILGLLCLLGESCLTLVARKPERRLEAS